MDLIIVESPTKARTLGRFLGKGFLVEATRGHIKDLPKSKLGVDVDRNFKPEYVDVANKKAIVSEIKRKANKVKDVYIATDPDREGEAIAYHVAEKLAGSNLKRISFHEITKSAVEDAIKKGGKIDKNLVNAQIARRVLDRLVGYKLSPLLWKKVRRGLSAGRVQTVALRLIIERERDIKDFKPQEYWEIYAELNKLQDKKSFLARLIKINGKKMEVDNKKTSQDVVKSLETSKYQVLSMKRKEVKRRAYPPFTTSTLTQAAANLFYWSAKKTMSIAQKLYEEGLITYHRTDSTNLANSAVLKVRNYIKKEYGDKYLPEKPTFYKTRSKVVQEAHEAIRPTNINSKFEIWDSRFIKDAELLYGLIWEKFVACQMNPSVYEETRIDIEAKPEGGNENYLLRVSGQIMKFDGWKKVMGSRKEKKGKNGVDLFIPEIEEGELLHLIKVVADQKFTQPPARYNDASLIKVMEKLGIGRPSTYAPTISTIQARNYVEKKEKRFIPTSIGFAVSDYLCANFSDLFNYSFTAEMEGDLDNVAKGEKKWRDMMSDFYKPFSKKILKVEKSSKRVKIETEKLGRKCPKCKEGELVIRIGKFGKFISCSRFPECDYTEKYVEKLGIKCPECRKGDVIIKTTKRGRKFYGCSRYPKCSWASWREPSKKKDKKEEKN